MAQFDPGQLIGVREPLAPIEKGEIAFPVEPEPETYTWLPGAAAGRLSIATSRSRPIRVTAMGEFARRGDPGRCGAAVMG